MGTSAFKTAATIVLSQKDNEYLWRNWDAISKSDLVNSTT
jgi:hypothetical protein